MSQVRNSKKNRKSVKLASPVRGFSCVSAKRAERYIRKELAHLDVEGRLVFRFGGEVSSGQIVAKGRPDFRLLVREFSGLDAFPDRAVFPPSPSVASKL